MKCELKKYIVKKKIKREIKRDIKGKITKEKSENRMKKFE